MKSWLVFCVAALGLTCGTDAVRPLTPEQVDLYTKVYDAYAAMNLSYDCFRYADQNQVAPCDCSACLHTQPDFVSKMCRFRETRETLYNDGEKPDFDPKNIWHKICEKKCARRPPTKCCDQQQGVVFGDDGCATCLPVRDIIGQHESCFVAELEGHKKNSPITWQQRYDLYKEAMKKAKLSTKCISYVIVKSANECDCEPCLQSEATSRELREKVCHAAANIRNNEDLKRPVFWQDRDYFENFCDFKKCPDMPRKCCPVAADSTTVDYPVDSKGCPACMPTSGLYGFGPRCEAKFLKLPAETYRRISSKLTHEP